MTQEELIKVLNSLGKNKIPSPYGWTLQFFIDLFDLLGDDLLRVVEDVQLLGKVMDKIDVTFLTLISKSEFPNSFDEYKPISFCNYVCIR